MRAVRWIEVGIKAQKRNHDMFRNTVGNGTALLTVVKANAYGHEQIEVAPSAAKTVVWLGLHTAAGARHLRQNDVIGVASHFANIEDTVEDDFAGLQLQRFHHAFDVLRQEVGKLPPYIHASCSAAAVLFARRISLSLEWVFRSTNTGRRAQPDCRGPWSTRATELN